MKEKSDLKKGNEGYVYIFSNPYYVGYLKVGRTSNLPDVRAKSLSRNSGVMGNFKPEWSKKVPNISLAESMLHYTLHKYYKTKEFFKLPTDVAIKVCEEALDRLFKPMESFKEIKEVKKLEKEAKVLLKELEKLESSNESETGIMSIPVGEKNENWEMVSYSLTYSFGKKAISLCLKEGKTGDPIRKRFISYRSNYHGAKRIDLNFNKSYILVNIVTHKSNEVKNSIKKVFGNLYSLLIFSETKNGFSFQVKTNDQFIHLKTFLSMGTEIKIGKTKIYKLF